MNNPQNNEFGDIDVPFSDEKKPDIYERLGRARPQRISPQPAVETPVSESETHSENADVASPSNTADAAQLGNAAQAANGNGEPATPEAPSAAAPAADAVASPVAEAPAAPAAANVADANADAETAVFAAGAPADANPGVGQAPVAGQAPAYSEDAAYATPAVLAAGAPPITAGSVTEGAQAADVDEEVPLTYEQLVERVNALGKRGTTDFGLLLIRLIAGAFLVADGFRWIFSSDQTMGLEFLKYFFGNIPGADYVSLGIPVLELVGGAMLLLGVGTPIGAMLGTIGAGLFSMQVIANFGDSLVPYAWSPPIIVGLLAFAIIFTGPGSWSIDRKFTWSSRPLVTSWIFGVVTIGLLLAAWFLLIAPNAIDMTQGIPMG